MAVSTNDPWDIINEIKKDVGRVGNQLARGIANIALQDLSETHKSIMKSYYAGYTPVKSYHYEYTDPKTGRHYSGIAHGYRRTYNLGENSRIPIGVKPKGKHGFQAILHVDSENMEDYVNSTGHTFPASAVFDMVWNQGVRGLPPGYRGHIGEVEIDTSPFDISISGTPDEAMEEFVQNWGATRGGVVADIVADQIRNS